MKQDQEHGPAARGGLRLLIADAHEVTLEGLRVVLRGRDDVEAVWVSSEPAEVVRLARACGPSVVLLDPEAFDASVCAALAALTPRPGLIANVRTEELDPMLERFRAGYDAVVWRLAPVDELLQAARAVVEGHAFVSPRLLRPMIDTATGRGGPGAVGAGTLRSRLTARQFEVAKLLAEGRGVKTIAASLELSARTVEAHRYQIMRKLDVRGVADLTRLAMKENVITAEGS